MYTFVLARAALELIPKSLWNHPSVRKWSKVRRKHPSRMLLDQTLHFSAIRKLEDYHNRGRADILHRALLTILDSRLNRRGLVSAVVIHTVEERFFFVRPDVRIPRHYFRFMGVMEDLLCKGVIKTKNGEILMQEAHGLEHVLEALSINYVICLEVGGKRKKIADILRQVRGNIAFIVGAAPRANVPKKLLEIADDIIEIDSQSLTTSYVLCSLVIELEQYHEITG